MDKKGENIISAEYEKSVVLTEPEVALKVEVYDFKNLAIHHIQSNLEKQLDKNVLMEEWGKSPEKKREKLTANLTWEYPDRLFTTQKSKLSVTEIKRIYETDYEPSDVIEYETKTGEQYVPPVPQFLMQTSQVMDLCPKGYVDAQDDGTA